MPQAEYEVLRPRSNATISRSSDFRRRRACEAADIPAASPPTMTSRSMLRTVVAGREAGGPDRPAMGSRAGPARDAPGATHDWHLRLLGAPPVLDRAGPPDQLLRHDRADSDHL